MERFCCRGGGGGGGKGREGKGEHQARIIRLVTITSADCRALDYCTVVGLAVCACVQGGREGSAWTLRSREGEKCSTVELCITLV